MILITGACAQGKTSFATNTLKKENMVSCKDIPDTFLHDLTLPEGCGCLDDYEVLVRRLMEQDISPTDFTHTLCGKYPHLCIILAEIGAGVIPMERTEREYRANAGRCGCIIAEASERVYRLMCGIPQMIKDGGDRL